MSGQTTSNALETKNVNFRLRNWDRKARHYLHYDHHLCKSWKVRRALGWWLDWPRLERQSDPVPVWRCLLWRMCKPFRCVAIGQYVRYDERSPPSSWDSRSWWRTWRRPHLFSGQNELDSHAITTAHTTLNDCRKTKMAPRESSLQVTQHSPPWSTICFDSINWWELNTPKYWGTSKWLYLTSTLLGVRWNTRHCAKMRPLPHPFPRLPSFAIKMLISFCSRFALT